MTVTPAAVFHRLVTLASRPSVMSIDPGFGDWLERHRSKILVIIEAAVNERGKKETTASAVVSVLPPGPWDEFLDAARRRELVETSERTALSPDTLWPIAVLYRAEWNIPWKAAFLSAADYLKTPRGDVDTADVVLEHTVDGGTLFSRLDKDDRDIAKALGMQWSRREGFWYRNSSRGRQLPTVLLSRAVDLATKKGLTIALEIQEPPGLEAARAAHRAAKESRAEVYEARAAKHEKRAAAAHAAADQISERFWGGQPILVGHHSEKKARRDQQKMWDRAHKAIEEEKAAEMAEAKAASVSAQADRYAPAQRSRLTTKGGFQEGTAGEVLALLKSRGKKDLGASGILQLKHKTTIYGFVFAFGPKPENEWMDRRRRVEITVSSREANIGNWYHSANGVKVPVGSRDAADVYADIVRAAKGWLESGGV